MKNLVIIGATSAIAHNCARLWIEDNYDEIYLVGRNDEKLLDMKNDLETRCIGIGLNTMIKTIILDDFSDPDKIESVVNSTCENVIPHTVLIAQGTSLTPNEEMQNNLSKLKASLEINSVSPILFLEKFVNVMLKENRGRIGVIGSVAGDRGRLTNYVYGSAKGCIEKYVQGVHHRLGYERSSLRVTLIKPGPTATPMTVNLPNQEKMADVKQVAQTVVRAVNKGKRIVYVPFKWKVIMAVIRNLPYFIFNHLKI